MTCILVFNYLSVCLLFCSHSILHWRASWKTNFNLLDVLEINKWTQQWKISMDKRVSLNHKGPSGDDLWFLSPRQDHEHGTRASNGKPIHISALSVLNCTALKLKQRWMRYLVRSDWMQKWIKCPTIATEQLAMIIASNSKYTRCSINHAFTITITKAFNVHLLKTHAK